MATVHFGIRRRQADHPNLAVDAGVFERLDLVLDEPFGFLAVFGVEAGAGLGFDVLAIEHAVRAAQTNHAITLFHMLYSV
jgi:hypothetical protein